MNHKLESRLLGEISTTSDMQMIPPYEDIPLWASLVAQLVKNLPAVLETRVQSLSWEDPLGERNGNPF